ncbi:MAG: protein kinase domain-containing protein [Bacteroidota bacterium]
MNLAENDLLLNRYRLIQLIGKGGFSVVWKAYDEITDVTLAIKIYAPDKGLDERGVKQFVKEYKLMQPLNHSSLLKSTHYDLVPDMKAPFLIMPFCEKGSLSSKLMDEDVLSEQDTAKLMMEIGDGLHYLHRQEPSILHQDIKPDNILIGDDGRYLLTDFGISNKMRSTLKKSTVGYSALTVAYAPPEKYANKPISASSDVFSLGVMLYECLTGDVPWGGDGGVMLLKGAYLPDLPDKYPDRLNQVIKACLVQEAEQRPTASQIAGIGKFYQENGHWPKPQQFLSELGTDNQEQSKPQQSHNKADSNAGQETLTNQEALRFMELQENYSRKELDKAYNKKKSSLKKEIKNAPFNSLKISLNKDLEKLEEARATALLMLRGNQGVKASQQKQPDNQPSAPSSQHQERKTAVHDYSSQPQPSPSGRQTQAFNPQQSQRSFSTENSTQAAKAFSEQPAHQPKKKSGKKVAAIAIAAAVVGGVALWFTVFDEGSQNDLPAKGLVSKNQNTEKAAIVSANKNTEMPGTQQKETANPAGTSERKTAETNFSKEKELASEQPEEPEQNKTEKKAPEKKVRTDYYALAIQKLNRNEYREAIDAFERAGSQGNGKALYNLGVMYLNGLGMIEDKAIALDYFQKAARYGSPEARFQAGYMYANGDGAAKDNEKAIEYYEMASENGLSMAMNNLARIYTNGPESLRNYSEAFRLLQQASESEDASVLNNLANMYRHGLGTAENLEKAAELYKEAASKGNAAAQNSLGNMYQFGYGVGKDYLEAFLWYRKAANQGYADAQNNLGYMYFNGLGVSKSEDEAKKWFSQASQNHQTAKNNLNNL